MKPYTFTSEHKSPLKNPVIDHFIRLVLSDIKISVGLYSPAIIYSAGINE